MHYSYEFKMKCVEMYHKGCYPATPEGLKLRYFHKKIRHWVRIVETNGPDALRRKAHYKIWSPEAKLDVVSQVIAGRSCYSVAIEAGISSGLLYQWVRKYKVFGYNGLINKKRGRQQRNPDMKKISTRKPPKSNESEYEELLRLRAENEYMKAEIEVIKKEIALREKKEAARLKAKRQQSSKNFVRKDTN